MVSNNQKCAKNLTPWKKGQSGNPKGRPKKVVSITSLIKEMIDEKADIIGPLARPDDITWRQQIARTVLVKCVQGDVPMIKELNERLEGRVPQPISGEGGGPITLKVVYDNAGIQNPPSQS